MSTQSYSVNGYGFYIDSSEESLRKFILNHKNTILLKCGEEAKEVLNFVSNPENEADIFEEFDSYNNEQNSEEGVYGIVADIMTNETGVRFSFINPMDRDCDNGCIMFEQFYPWYFNEYEKELTEGKLYQMMKKYAEEVGTSDTEPDTIQMEMFG